MINYLPVALRIADWIEQNQGSDPSDANRGRFLYTCRPDGRERMLSTSWTTGVGMMALLCAYEASGEERYLASARCAGEYLHTLQIRDRKESRGMVREVTPQTAHCFPRDGLTAAWGLLHLYRVTGDEGALNFVRLHNEWFAKSAWTGEWVRNACCLPEEPDRASIGRVAGLYGNYQGGCGNYFADVARCTGDASLSDQCLLPLAENYAAWFLPKSGEPRVLINAETHASMDDLEGPLSPRPWKTMHKLNDDFALLSLLDAHASGGGDHLLAAAERFGGYLLSQQRPDGGFGDPEIHSASATGAIELLHLARLTGKSDYAAGAERALAHLPELQHESGGLFGAPYASDAFTDRDVLNIRVSAYACIALLQAVMPDRIKVYRADTRGEVK